MTTEDEKKLVSELEAIIQHITAEIAVREGGLKAIGSIQAGHQIESHLEANIQELKRQQEYYKKELNSLVNFDC